MVTIEILDGGPLTTVQDARGRRAWRHLGVPVGGAADPWSAALANRLAGNPAGAGLLEVTLPGASLRVEAATVLAVAGGLEVSVDGLPAASGAARRVRAGAVVRVQSGRGARGYLAIAGGIEVPPVLGSRSTELRTGFGGLDGRPLRAGDRISIGDLAGRPMRSTAPPPDTAARIRVVEGPHAEPGVLDALVSGSFTVSTDADRIGVRLEGVVDGGGEVASMGLPLGSIQLPPDGRPILMLADRPVTGGYRVPAVVIGADIGRVAQLRPGDAVRFASVSLEVAGEARRRAEDELAALEPLDEREEDDELGWAGSHR